MADSKLTPLQRAVLDEFFRRESDFYLTGGGALVARRDHVHRRGTRGGLIRGSRMFHG